MAPFTIDLRELKFTLFEQIEIQRLLEHEPFRELARDDLDMILDEACKLAREVFAPAGVAGDREGCTFEGGKVRVPPSYHEPFRRYCEAQWLALNHSPEWGGQGAPRCLRTAVDDMFFGANIGLNLGMLLTPGAAHLIEAFGDEALKQIYLRRMYSGEWGGTMCLTEPHAGSDVGSVSTKAIREGDQFRLEGEKIFITYGDHDLTENIVHCVLARIEGAPKGTKGLSLFAVPKYRVEADGSLGAFNNVVCTNIEHKLGIHGSPTCTLNFGGSGPCLGALIGGEHQGMPAMFQLMNDARLAVGLQGVALANAAYQAALGYARERLQGPDVERFKDPEAPRVPIVRHPDIRLSLMRQKAYAEGCRALVLYTAYCMDVARCAPTVEEREEHAALVELLTPICKAYGSDMGFRVTEWALQTFGGYGYLRDYPAEQLLRDCKIASIYEGTNGIQAMDLVARKLPARGGANMLAVYKRVKAFIEAQREHVALGPAVAALEQATATWSEVNRALATAAMRKDWLMPLLHASPYLALCGDLLVSFMLLQQAEVAWRRLVALCAAAGVDPLDGAALRRLATSDDEVRFYDGKVKTARFFCASELPRLHARAAAITGADRSALEIVFNGE
ncbi:MAG: acyl-CoA dehydrogenase [Proteobacteria bacterium]|nr:acyl-CoA dehydrogenase [Pseudomonadota bacterium]